MTGPLQGIRVIEIGQLLAGPFTGSLLAYFGAEVIKIEPPEGDPIRQWRVVQEGTSLWWHSLGRNKKSITLNLRQSKGCVLARQLIDKADVVIENFKPGVMENWGLGPATFHDSNPGLVYARISGYGQNGPYAKKPGFASVCEGMSGFRYLNGFPDAAPVRPNLSIGDTIAGLHTAFGIVMALLARERTESGHTGKGQIVDVALYEAMFNLLEAVVPEYSGAGVIRQPSGTTVTGIVPTNTYRCSDNKYVVIGGNGDSIFQRLMSAVGRDDLAHDARMTSNSGRVSHEPEIDTVLASWCATLPIHEVIQQLEAAQVPVGPIYDIADLMADPHARARELFERVEINGKPLEIPAMMPRLTDTPGRTHWPGPRLGEHTEEILRDLLAMDEAEIKQILNRA